MCYDEGNFSCWKIEAGTRWENAHQNQFYVWIFISNVENFIFENEDLFHIYSRLFKWVKNLRNFIARKIWSLFNDFENHVNGCRLQMFALQVQSWRVTELANSQYNVITSSVAFIKLNQLA